MQQIVIAVDGSPEAWFAADIGLALARAQTAAVVFLHASTETLERLTADDPDLRNRQSDLATADAVLGEALDRAEEAGVEAQIELSRGNTTGEIVAEILGLAQELQADLVVTGSRGRGTLVQSVLGSVSRAILRDTTTPALVVKVPHAHA